MIAHTFVVEKVLNYSMKNLLKKFAKFMKNVATRSLNLT